VPCYLQWLKPKPLFGKRARKIGYPNRSLGVPQIDARGIYMLKITVIIVLTLFGLLVGWWETAGIRGYMVASFDVARGHYEEQGYGLPGPGRPEYARLLRERYGIEYRQVALCTVSDELVNYADAYNSVSVAAAQRKFGPDIFEKTYKEAENDWYLKRFETGLETSPLPLRLR